MDKTLATKIGVAFKREGLVVHGAKTMEYVIEQMKRHRDQVDFLSLMLRAIDRQSLRQNLVDVAAANKAVAAITVDVTSKVESESLKVIGALECPRHRFHESRKTFVADSGSRALHGTAEDLAAMFRNRFELIRQRVMRHPLFVEHELTTVKSLLGATGRKIVFGMLTRNSMGQLILEDLNNTVVLDVANCKPEEGLYTDHCMVLADGELRQGTFVVFSISMPPLEEARTTLATFPNVDLFGGAPDQALRSEIELFQKSAEDTMFVVLSDVWLDKPGCMAKLEQLFEGYKDIVPTAFIFMGNYTSRPLSQTADVGRLQTAFAGLARLIVKYKSLALGSRWIFSRGPADGGGPLVYPQFELPDFFVQTLKQRLPNVTFTTNPFRLRWCNVRMVFFRENLISKLRRHALFPKLLLAGNPPELLVRTLLEQSHLCPVPQSICPLYWNLDQAMHLYPIPDMLILGDSYEQYVVREREPDYIACNPGSFGADASFVVVRPSTLEVEESRIPDEGEEEVDELENEGQDRAAPPEQEREEQIEAEEREAEEELEEEGEEAIAQPMDEGGDEQQDQDEDKELDPTQLLRSDDEQPEERPHLPPKDKMEMDD